MIDFNLDAHLILLLMSTVFCTFCVSVFIAFVLFLGLKRETPPPALAPRVLVPGVKVPAHAPLPPVPFSHCVLVPGVKFSAV